MFFSYGCFNRGSYPQDLPVGRLGSLTLHTTRATRDTPYSANITAFPADPGTPYSSDVSPADPVRSCHTTRRGMEMRRPDSERPPHSQPPPPPQLTLPPITVTTTARGTVSRHLWSHLPDGSDIYSSRFILSNDLQSCMLIGHGVEINDQALKNWVEIWHRFWVSRFQVFYKGCWT